MWCTEGADEDEAEDDEDEAEEPAAKKKAPAKPRGRPPKDKAAKEKAPAKGTAWGLFVAICTLLHMHQAAPSTNCDRTAVAPTDARQC